MQFVSFLNLYIMERIPIVFSFDDNLEIPAIVCITSLLQNVHSETYYEIYILHPKGCLNDKSRFMELRSHFNQFEIDFIEVDSIFNEAYQVRGITSPTYYRLLIPHLLADYDKVIYSDVDVIFRSDLKLVYQTYLNEEYIAATEDLGMMLTDDGRKHMKSLGLSPGESYYQAGFILMNCKKMREDGVVDTFIKFAKHQYKYQDQDILNIVCKKKCKLLPMKYNMTDYVYTFIFEQHNYFNNMSDEEINEALCTGTIHYNGHKPWKKYSLNFDIWWEQYRNSVVYDNSYYFDFFHKKVDLYDRLPLWKRVKILVRYFIYGRLK